MFSFGSLKRGLFPEEFIGEWVWYLTPFSTNITVISLREIFNGKKQKQIRSNLFV